MDEEEYLLEINVGARKQVHSFWGFEFSGTHKQDNILQLTKYNVFCLYEVCHQVFSSIFHRQYTLIS